MKNETDISVLDILAENLKHLRIAKKLSLRDLASECKIDHSDIAKIEKAKINITLLTLQELANTLKTTPENLITKDAFKNQE